MKDLENSVTKLETENHNLGNKVSLLQGDVDRAEKRVEEVRGLLPLTQFLQCQVYSCIPLIQIKKMKSKSAAGDKDEAHQEALQRKIAMLEKQVDDKERDRKEAVERCVFYTKT